MDRVAVDGPCRAWNDPEPIMSLPRTVADVLREHVTLEIESLDRIYLNVYQPHLQLERKVYRFLREQRAAVAPSRRCTFKR
jgi:hypothetical protein